MAGRRLSVCYAAPGQNLLPPAGPTRNVLSVAEALSQWADVTVAFRTILEPIDTSAFRVMAIEPGASISNGRTDDNATRGLYPVRHMSYCRTLWAFARQRARSFDVVLEKGWRLSGLLSAAFHKQGVPGVLVENDARRWTEPLNGARNVGKYLLHRAGQLVAGSCSRRLPVIVAETDDLKAMLVAHRRISPNRIHVIGLGVDHGLFRPADRVAARASLGIRPDVLLLLYVGAMDEYHDLEPVIEALGRVSPSSVEFHVVGDGEYRRRYEVKARDAHIVSRFHGHVLYATVPQYIAAADLCIAPYRTSAFHDGLVTFSTLKVPEYLACGRPVVGVPSASVRRLVQDGVNGFVLPNDVCAWVSFLRALPSRERLASMGGAAVQAVESVAWDNTARSYLELCEHLVSDRRRGGVARGG
jgi:glycosyltransferase involved in cell wall biosynthesis